MSKSNISQSISTKLLELSRKRGVDYNIVLIWYGIERFLYRLSKSRYSRKFVLKGAMLFAIWAKQPLRPTKDLDLSAYETVNDADLKKIFEEICHTEVEDDGIAFNAENIEISEIRENQEYQGKRIKLCAKLGNARIRLQIDIGFADVIRPAPENMEFPVLLRFPAPLVMACSKETVISEKFHAMVILGITNSRMKDFYDIWVMSSQFEFDGLQLTNSISATFKRRKTKLNTEIPLSLTADFMNDPSVNRMWNAFINKTVSYETKPPLNQVISKIKNFLVPVLEHISLNKPFTKKWSGGKWI